MTKWLDIKAGAEAYLHIQEKGLQQEDINLLLGASGGPKWFVLQGLDNYLFGEFFAQRKTPLQLLGTSAGAWRFASLGRAHAAKASELFCELYRAQTYSAKPTAAEITDNAKTLLEHYVSDEDISEILNQQTFLHHMIVARCNGWAALESRRRQAIGLARAAAGNLLSRRALKSAFERVIFHHPQAGTDLGEHWDDLPTSRVALSSRNFRQTLLATGSIPMVLEGVRDIPGAPPGVYRDGGITDYHFDVDLSRQSGLVLYPHFHSEVIPGWFDKKLSWRRTSGKQWPNVIFMHPSQAFLDALPYGKIPDRNDFVKLDADTRQAYWKKAVEVGYRMADQFAEWQQKGTLGEHVELWQR
ncbi:alpha/beta hydrolase [Aliidiomarina sedimenti]|uniref:Alpha/beta hydrolase n=1 Tax=Aliidiomarina sedimenti TaxID=1933879 RepID=A0ABY0C1U1_9GAMM|nr:alpha/beta hydrolase [Aliidiomarina sedimenti]RUO31821.1 alpha/beta hydrolase [Aliidiomarina sedimenti]